MMMDTAVTSAGRRRRRPVEPFSSISPALDGRAGTGSPLGSSLASFSSRVDGTEFRASLASFSCKIDDTLRQARYLTDQAEAEASNAGGASSRLRPGAGSATTATAKATANGAAAPAAAQYLSKQSSRKTRINERLEAVADALLQFPASGGGHDGSSSLADLTRLCTSVYEANAVQLAVVEDAMVHGNSGNDGGRRFQHNDDRYTYDGMDARRAAIAAMERRQWMLNPGGNGSPAAAPCNANANANAVNVTDDASTIGSLGTEELLTDGIWGEVGTACTSCTSTGTNASRAPLGFISENTALGRGGSGSGANHEDSAKISCHTSGLPLEAIREGEAESSSSSTAHASVPNTSEVARDDDDDDDDDAIVDGVRSPSPRALSPRSSMAAMIMTPATPATPNLADLHLSQCTIDTLESTQGDFADQDIPAVKDSTSGFKEDEAELCLSAAPKTRSDMVEFIGDGDSIGGAACRLNDSSLYVQEETSVTEIVEVGTTFTDAMHTEDADSSHSDESLLDVEEEDDEDEEFSMAATIERNPVFEETLMNDGCSVATASPTIVAERKLAQIMAQVARQARGESVEDVGADDEDDASSTGTPSSSFSDSDVDSIASKSSIDLLIEESDHDFKADARVLREEGPTALGSGGQIKRRTPILDRYRVQTTNNGGYRVSPKDSEAKTTSPKVLPFGECSNEGSDEHHSQESIAASDEKVQRLKPRPKHVPTHEEHARTRKVYPRTPISKFPVPREEDEDNLSETDDELDVATATPHVKPEGLGQLNREEEDVTSRRLSSSGGEVPFSPLATAIKPKVNAAANSISSASQPLPAACRTPLAAAWIAKNMPEEKERLLRILSPKPTPSPSVASSSMESRSSSTNERTSGANWNGNANLIGHLTPEEYGRAPRIVKSQVTYDEVGAAVTTLNAWFASHGGHVSDAQQPVEITEDQAYGLLGNMFDRRKAKTLCMSLCHWKKLLMRGSSDGDCGLVFQVVNI